MRRALFVAWVITGMAFIVAGGAYATREAHVCPPAHLEPGPTLESMQAACVQAGGAWRSQMEGGVITARCRPWLAVAP